MLVLSAELLKNIIAQILEKFKQPEFATFLIKTI